MTGEMRSTLSNDGVTLQYEVVGEGPPVAMLHGGLVGRSAFSRQREALAKDYRLIIPSSRGHDGTEILFPDDYGFANTETSDLSAIFDAEGIERASLIGHSSGGAIAFAYGRDFGDRVDRMVLIEPTLLALLPSEILDPVRAATSDIIKKGETEGGIVAIRATMEYIGGEAWQSLGEDKQQAQLQRLEPLAPIPVPHLKALLGFAVKPSDLEKLRPPTMLVFGEKTIDFYIGIAARCREIRPDIDVMTIDNAGHNSHRERPDIVNGAILGFLGGSAR